MTYQFIKMKKTLNQFRDSLISIWFQNYFLANQLQLTFLSNQGQATILNFKMCLKTFLTTEISLLKSHLVNQKYSRQIV